MLDYLPIDCKKALLSNGSVEVGSITLKIEDLFRIETTTSFKLDRDENDNDVGPPEPTLKPIFKSDVGGPASENIISPYPSQPKRPHNAIIRWSDRNLQMKWHRFWYIVCKIAYMGFWFYWGGYIVLFESYTIPYTSDMHKLFKQTGYGEFATSIWDPPQKDAVEDKEDEIDEDFDSKLKKYRKQEAYWNDPEKIWMQLYYDEEAETWKRDPNDQRGFSFEDWQEMRELKESNKNFENYYGFSNEKYLQFDHDFFMFGFYFYDDIMKDLQREKEQSDQKIQQIERELASKSQEVEKLNEKLDAVMKQLGIN